jgi:uncharacterized membrane protein YgcG
MNTETKIQQQPSDELELTPQQIQLMQQMEQQNNYTDELKDFASKIASQIENEKNNQQEQEMIPVVEKSSKRSLVDKILLHAKEPLFVSIIILILSASNNVLISQISKIMPKVITGNKLNVIGMLIVSLLGGVLYYIGKKFLLDKKNII